jgi:hypothetical protein
MRRMDRDILESFVRRTWAAWSATSLRPLATAVAAQRAELERRIDSLTTGNVLRERWDGPPPRALSMEAIVNVANNNCERLVPVLVSHSCTLGVVRARHRPSADTRPSHYGVGSRPAWHELLNSLLDAAVAEVNVRTSDQPNCLDL